MAVLDDVVLVADGGDVTVGRQTATFVYGEFNVVLPHGREKVETDDRLQDGYVYRPKGGIKGPFDVGFVRADATVDLEADTSDLEVVVDAAQKQAEGDVFFERDITTAGLGQFVLDRDFRVGDVVTVELWGKRLRLPVTAGDYVASVSEGPAAARVHVGGQLISDAEAVARQNDDLRRQIAREKAERVRQVSSESSARRTAVDAERSARTTEIATERSERAEAIGAERRARVSGDKSLSDRIDALPSSEVLNAEIEGLNSKIGGLNTDLTLLKQGEINEIQRVINDKQTGINALNNRFQQEQLKVNALNDDFRAEQERINKFQGELSKTNKAASDANAEALHAQDLVVRGMPRMLHVDDGKPSIWDSSEGSVNNASAFGKLFFSRNIDGGRANFRASGGWTGVVWLMGVTVNGSTDIKVETITSSNRFLQLIPNGLGNRYKASTAWIFPDVAV